MNRQSHWISGVKVVRPYTLAIEFTDGAQGELNLHDWIFGKGPIFKPMEDPAFFAQVRLTQTGGTIEWPNGVDFCPNVLHEQITGEPWNAPMIDLPEPASHS